MDKKKPNKEDKLEDFIRNNREDFDSMAPPPGLWNDITPPKEDKLEAFVTQERSAFDTLEPSSEIWKKIEQSLPSSADKKLSWGTYVWRAAAVVAILLSSAAIWMQQGPAEVTVAEQVTPQQNNQSTEGDVNIPELSEAEAYYGQQVNAMLAEVSRLSLDDPSIRESMQYDIAELDSAYVDLKNDLKDGIHNQDIVEAMIQNYRLKIQILDDILHHLKKQQLKSRENEQA